MDIKFRLFQEGKIIPELALGFYDLGGTGDYSAEYIEHKELIRKIHRVSIDKIYISFYAQSKKKAPGNPGALYGKVIWI